MALTDWIISLMTWGKGILIKVAKYVVIHFQLQKTVFSIFYL